MHKLIIIAIIIILSIYLYTSKPTEQFASNWKRYPNTAYYLGGLKKENVIQPVINNTTPKQCAIECDTDQNCKGFFFNKAPISGGEWKFNNNSCVRTNTPLWSAQAPASDSYYKK
jgi:hypothetical protein